RLVQTRICRNCSCTIRYHRRSLVHPLSTPRTPPTSPFRPPPAPPPPRHTRRPRRRSRRDLEQQIDDAVSGIRHRERPRTLAHLFEPRRIPEQLANAFE